MSEYTRRAHTHAANSHEAAQEFFSLVAQPQMELVLFFCSSDYDLDVLAAEMKRLFGGVPVIGCTTAGEIGPAGYCEHSISGVSFSSNACHAVYSCIDAIRARTASECQTFAQQLLRELEEKAPQSKPENSFAFVLIDGLSVREESVAYSFQTALGTLPLVGGSAGDGMNFDRTYIYYDGKFRADCAALVLVTTQLPFKVFKTQHFVPTDRRLVITKADTQKRVVYEINGLPAATEYARLVGVDLNHLTPKSFASSPVVVLIDGSNYVRSMQKVNPDGSVTFFCAIEEGLVLRVASGVDLMQNLEEAFAQIQREIGPPQLVVACDCMLRKTEILQNGLEGRVAKTFARNNAVGFNTYGEQFRGVHVNQTLTGVAIGTLSS